MSSMRTIEIDFDIHKLVENERRGFDEPPYLALRRLLGLPEAARATAPTPTALQAVGQRSWSDQGVTLPHGTVVRMTYNGRTHEGQIVDGQWAVEGKTFGSPSGAASGVAVTKKGGTTNLDGWGYWLAKVPGSDEFVSIREMYRSALARA